MKKKNTSAKKKIPNFYFNKLKNRKIKKIYLEFKKNINEFSDKKLCVAVSGGSDSLALTFLVKCMSLETKIDYLYCHVDHKLRSESSKEASKTKKLLKDHGINLHILKWAGKKKISNIQEQARLNRYNLLFKESAKNTIDTILTAHHVDDLYENFFIRLLRGSGLKGLISFKNKVSRIDKNKNILILRPLLNISKKDLMYVSKNTFGSFVNDSSNNNEKFLRIHVRKIINKLFSNKKNNLNIGLALSNLDRSNEAIEYYVKKNIEMNVKSRFGNKVIISDNFFNHPDEVVFRSLNIVLNNFSKKTKLTRGSKIINLYKSYRNSEKYFKTTLSGCIFEKVSKSLIISREI